VTRIKICGITNKVDAINVSKLGVDMMGFIFYEKSKRFVKPIVAKDIINELPDQIEKVGVFVDEKEANIRSIAEEVGINTIQLHGSETPEFCSAIRRDYKVIKAFRIKGGEDLRKVNDYDVDYYLMDTFKTDSVGGTGEVFDWKLLKDFEFLRPVILSGGLNPINVGRAMKEVVPYGVDVATGVEKSPGKKDAALLKKFVEEVRKTE
jgi:Phosphoribosylanthranilate isomerase